MKFEIYPTYCISRMNSKSYCSLIEEQSCMCDYFCNWKLPRIGHSFLPFGSGHGPKPPYVPILHARPLAVFGSSARSGSAFRFEPIGRGHGPKLPCVPVLLLANSVTEYGMLEQPGCRASRAYRQTLRQAYAQQHDPRQPGSRSSLLDFASALHEI